MVAQPTRAIRVFYSYAHEDNKLRDELNKHLSTMKRLNQITEWHDRDIHAGTEWKDEIDTHLNTAHIILLLISPDFMASEYCYSIEMTRALERHERGEAHVIPIILRPVDWKGAPFDKLQVLPADAQPITIWLNQDQAFLDVAKGIRKVVQELQSKTKEQWVEEGRAHHQAHRYEKALGAYEQALDIDSTYTLAYRNKGDVLYDLKRYEEALIAYEQAVRLDPTSARAHKRRGNVLLHFKRYGEALAAYEWAIQLDPHSPRIYNDKGNVLYSLMRYEEALTAYEKAIQLDPNFASACNNKGNALSRLLRYPEALLAYEQAIRLDPNFATPHNNRGKVLFHLKRYLEALTAFEQAIHLDSNFTLAYENMGNTLEQLGRLKEAELVRVRVRELGNRG
jgi:tetratricopeptide (TPR) repeat protein